MATMEMERSEKPAPKQSEVATIHSDGPTMYGQSEYHPSTMTGPTMDILDERHDEIQHQPGPRPVSMDYAPAPRLVTPMDRLTGTEPQPIDCPNCHKQTQTRVQQEHSNMTYIKGILLGFVCCICLICLPCIQNWDQDIDYYCASCGKQLAHKPYNGPVQVLSTPQAAMVPSQYPPAPERELQRPGAAPAVDQRKESGYDFMSRYDGPK